MSLKYVVHYRVDVTRYLLNLNLNMLDFFTIDDNQPKPDFPEKAGLDFAGQLDEKTFFSLQQKGIIAKEFDYYTDFRLDTALKMRLTIGILIRFDQIQTCYFINFTHSL